MGEILVLNLARAEVQLKRTHLALAPLVSRRPPAAKASELEPRLTQFQKQKSWQSYSENWIFQAKSKPSKNHELGISDMMNMREIKIINNVLKKYNCY
jgi:hypothetical protein